MPIGTRKPRIITETVKRLRQLAAELLGETFGRDDVVADLERWADELDAYDARETKKDPSKRRRKSVRR